MYIRVINTMKIPQQANDSKDLIDVTVDARQLHCPMPLLKAKQALNRMQDGQILLVLATDSGSWRDMRQFVEQAKHQMLNASSENNEYSYTIKKGL